MGWNQIKNDVRYVVWALGITGWLSGALRASLRLVQRVTGLRHRRTVEPSRAEAQNAVPNQETIM